MTYLWLKAFHVGAVAAWVGGMLVSAITVAALIGGRPAASPDRADLLQSVRGWDRHVTSPAMLLVWGLGLTLAYQGAWFREPWLTLKLALVLGLSALHGALSGTLRRLARTQPGAPSRLLGIAPPAIVAVVALIAVLVVVKPF